MGEPARWHDLACPCGSTHFTKLYVLRHHSAGGTSTEEAGLQCHHCQKPANVAAMWHQIQVQRMRAQIADMEQQLQEDPGAPTDPASSPVSNG